jgi:hypothetical protein
MFQGCNSLEGRALLIRHKRELFKVSKLSQEIDSWGPFVESLALEDRELFKDMVQETWNYLDSVEFCKDEYTTEAFILSLLIGNQKAINSLSNKIGIMKKSDPNCSPSQSI